MAEVTIHQRRAASDPIDPEGVRPALAVIYSTPAVPPRTVYIAGEDPSDEQVAAAIREDLAGLETEGPQTLEV